MRSYNTRYQRLIVWLSLLCLLIGSLVSAVQSVGVQSEKRRAKKGERGLVRRANSLSRAAIPTNFFCRRFSHCFPN